MIRKAMVIGSGVMGAQIAGHLANCGLDVMLIDMLPSDEALLKKNRNAVAEAGKAGLLKLKPAPMMTTQALHKISVGNLEDDLKRVDEFDWIIEVIVERSDIKRNLFQKIDGFRKSNNIVTSNTSGISIAELSEGLSDSFQKSFLGTHFFNPPRYLHLMEIIPGPKTDADIIKKMSRFLTRQIGKGVVMCKDTPNFIGNRVGVYGLMIPFQFIDEFKLSVSEVDALTGPLIGRPKSATFRTADVVGLDTMGHVLNTLVTKLDHDPEKKVFEVPAVLQKLVDQKALGDKTGKGFYQKSMVNGKKAILSLQLGSMDYAEEGKPEFPAIKEFAKHPHLGERIAKLVKAEGRAGQFLWKVISRTILYAAQTVQEIAHDIVSVDEAIKFGFGWDMGPFEIWDALGLENTVKRMKKDGLAIPSWVLKHVENKHTSFYNYSSDGRKGMADPFKGGWMAVKERGINLVTAKKQNPVLWQNKSVNLVDIGDGVACLEFQTYMNSAGKELIESIIESCQRAEDNHKALVIANHGKHFCVGANLKELVDAVGNKDFALARRMIQNFQKASMAIKYCGVPVVVAAHGMALGGGCEFVMHAQKPVLAAESYIGLVEIGVGLIPAGGGTKEMAIKASDAFQKTGDWNKSLKHGLETLGMAKVSGSAFEANDLYLSGKAKIVMNQDYLIDDAKYHALNMVHTGHTPGNPRKDILVSGAAGYSNLDLALYLYEESRMISAYDGVIARSIAKILTGGGVSNVTTVSEEYLLELELETFIGLLENEKTMARVEHMLKTGKALRN